MPLELFKKPEAIQRLSEEYDKTFKKHRVDPPIAITGFIHGFYIFSPSTLEKEGRQASYHAPSLQKDIRAGNCISLKRKSKPLKTIVAVLFGKAPAVGKRRKWKLPHQPR